MVEHLTAHKGVINKLELYQEKVTIIELRDMIRLQANMMRVHVNIMLTLINPYHHGYVELPPLNAIHPGSFHLPHHMEYRYRAETDNKWITLESHTTAKSMADENYSSALMIQDQNVRHVYAEMALQQFQVMEMYAEFMKRMGWDFTPRVPTQDQINTYQHFQKMFA
ncbi:hypothetical protein [Virgibacillus dakarensis]|uniref:hypothetical protein n=1 Tax=Virgibacillus dakarensis TaxID=1917889 RepID=UPI001E43088E|nr:hypothetical protein [Virgibacillus dakarensis]